MKVHAKLIAAVGSAVLFLVLGSSIAHAGFVLGDAANYAVLFEGAGANHLAINNGQIDGNIGIGAPSGSTTSQAQLNSPLTINGNINFAGAVNYQIGNGVVVNGSITPN